MAKSPRPSSLACRASRGTEKDRIGLSIPRTPLFGPQHFMSQPRNKRGAHARTHTVCKYDRDCVRVKGKGREMSERQRERKERRHEESIAGT